MWVALLADAIHAAVGMDAQEEAAVLAVEPLGVLEVAWWEGGASKLQRICPARQSFLQETAVTQLLKFKCKFLTFSAPAF